MSSRKYLIVTDMNSKSTSLQHVSGTAFQDPNTEFTVSTWSVTSWWHILNDAVVNNRVNLWTDWTTVL